MYLCVFVVCSAFSFEELDEEGKLASLREQKKKEKGKWTTEIEETRNVIDCPNIDWILFIADLFLSQSLPISIASGFAKHKIPPIDIHHSAL